MFNALIVTWRKYIHKCFCGKERQRWQRQQQQHNVVTIYRYSCFNGLTLKIYHWKSSQYEINTKCLGDLRLILKWYVLLTIHNFSTTKPFIFIWKNIKMISLPTTTTLTPQPSRPSPPPPHTQHYLGRTHKKWTKLWSWLTISCNLTNLISEVGSQNASY